jgi:cobalt-zinc-cadmium resistance protein CzcA
VGTLAEGNRRFAVQLRLDVPPGAASDSLARFSLPLGSRGSTLLGDLVDIAQEDAPAQLSREQGRRRIVVEANVRGRDLASFVAELKRSLAEMRLPPGYYTELSGQFENLIRALERLVVVVPATLLAIFMLLYLTFGEVRPAALILLNVPVAASGGLVALAARGLPFSVSAAVGFIALFGVATMNGVVLLSAIRERERSGDPPLVAARRGADERLRPVLTTAVVASLGFLPMALATGTGAEVQRPLATVVMGGLLSATLLTLLVLPALSAWRRGLTTAIVAS